MMINRWGHGPIYRRFKQQQSAAQQRGIAWRLPYWEWLQIWQDSGHLEERGRHDGQWCMARNGDAGAYEASNVKIVRVETNNRNAQVAKKQAAQKRTEAVAGLISGYLGQST